MEDQMSDGGVLEVGKTIKLRRNDKYESYLELAKQASKFSELPIPKDNPFRYRLETKIGLQRVVKGAVNALGSVDIIDRETGVVTSGVEENRVFVKRERVDNEAFIKIYSDRIKQMFNLTHPAIKIFGYFLHIMQRAENINRDVVYLDTKECMEFCGYKTHPMIYIGLKELVVNGFIARHPRQNHFYVDPNAAFNGNRIVVMEEYVRKEADYFEE